MADFDGVPWFVGGTAVPTADTYRSLAYAALRGGEGITAAADLKVTALSSPDARVQVAPGVCGVLLNASGYAGEAYVARLNGVATVDVSPTGDGISRSDLIVVRVEDPTIISESWPLPTDVPHGPYVFARVISDVAPTTTTVAELELGYDAIVLARVDLPPNSATVTSGMITDLRRMANERHERQVYSLTLADDVDVDSVVSFIPLISGAENGVRVPTWASKAVLRGDALSLTLFPGDYDDESTAELRVNLGGQVTSGIPVTRESGPERFTAAAAGTVDITADMRGTQVTAALELQVTAGDGTFVADTSSTGVIDIEFIEAPV